MGDFIEGGAPRAAPLRRFENDYAAIAPLIKSSPELDRIAIKGIVYFEYCRLRFRGKD
jgi:hypothetical protein